VIGVDDSSNDAFDLTPPAAPLIPPHMHALTHSPGLFTFVQHHSHSTSHAFLHYTVYSTVAFLVYIHIDQVMATKSKSSSMPWKVQALLLYHQLQFVVLQERSCDPPFSQDELG